MADELRHPFSVSMSASLQALMEPVWLLLNAVARRDAQLPRTIISLPWKDNTHWNRFSCQSGACTNQDKLDLGPQHDPSCSSDHSIWTWVVVECQCLQKVQKKNQKWWHHHSQQDKSEIGSNMHPIWGHLPQSVERLVTTSYDSEYLFSYSNFKVLKVQNCRYFEETMANPGLAQLIMGMMDTHGETAQQVK